MEFHLLLLVFNQFISRKIMITHKYSVSIVCTSIFIIFFILGCSGGKSPVAPPGSDYSIDSAPIIGLIEMKGSFNAKGIMGIYEMIINPESMNAELINTRTNTIGESWIVNGAAFFTITPCATCLKISAISQDLDGNPIFAFEVTHPFEKGDLLKPPSAINRLDLDVFDLALVVQPVNTTSQTYSLLGKDAHTGFCINPAGYTDELANIFSPTDPAALPYFLCIDDSIDAIPPLATFNKFEMETSTTFDVGFDMTAGTFQFNLFLTMGYGASAKKSGRLNPKYYNPEFNRKSAWKVAVTPPEGVDPPVMGNTWNDSDSVTVFDVTIQVYDWQIAATVYGLPDFENAPEDNIFASSNVSNVALEIPGMNNTLPSVITEDSGSGTPDDPLIYSVSIANENLLPAGVYTGLVKVSDERVPLSTLDGRDHLINTDDGIILEFFDLIEYATYQTFRATIVIGCGPITGDILSGCPSAGIANSQSLDFEVSASSANGGGNIILYEVDFDYDGFNFTMDDSNTDGIFNGVGPFVVPDPCDNNIPYDFTVAFRGTDECAPPNITIFTTCLVTVDSCCPTTTGDLSVISINRGEGGVDPDRITSLDFDWDDHPCAVEYAIERADGWTGTGWTLLDTSSTSDYKYQPVGLDLDNDIRFRVIARAEIGGNPATDYQPSFEVFTLFACNAGGETGNWFGFYPTNVVGNNFRFTGWGGPPTVPDVDDWPSTDKYFAGLYYRNTVSSQNAWTIMHSDQVPDLPGQKEAFCDGYWITNFPWTSTMGMCVGTISDTNFSGSEYCDFEPSNLVYNSLFPYNRSGSGIDTEFCETGQSAWVFTTGNWTHVGYYLNDLCDNGDRDYIAFGWANGSDIGYPWISGYMDGFVYIVH